MKKYLADLKDLRWDLGRIRRTAYRCGSVFKGCFNCGEFEDMGRGRKKYSSGYNVYRAYDPKWTRWTYKCFDCGSIDEACWEKAKDVGQQHIGGSRFTVFKTDPRPAKDQLYEDRLEVARYIGYGLDKLEDKPATKKLRQRREAERTVEMDDQLVARLKELLLKGDSRD